ncbi:MAG: hypothetical protein QNJ91_03170 [Gammaproteobacteria bacterium]|nr:hypothetical protein [Gammaproteobacteria bacterium]
MLNWLKNKAGSQNYVGIDVYDDGFAVAVIDGTAATRPLVTAARWCPLRADEAIADVLSAVVRDLGLRGQPVVATLPHDTYSLVQLERPEVPDDELAEAMRWRVRDLIDFPVEQAVIDVFPLPESQRPGAPALLYVVVAKAQAVDALVEALHDAGLSVMAIDLVEMAIRNLAMHVDRPQRPRAYLQLQSAQTVIEIADATQVYLSRRVMQDFDVEADRALLHAQMENLALEVQRSLDYFESQYALGPADRLTVLVADDALFAAFRQEAGVFLTVPVERFGFAAVASAADVSVDALGRGFTALGAALRGLPWAA